MTPAAFEDLVWWIEKDRSKALKISKLIEAIQRDPFQGIGEPEPLSSMIWAGLWSRRIDREHRLVFEVSEIKIQIIGFRFHDS